MGKSNNVLQAVPSVCHTRTGPQAQPVCLCAASPPRAHTHGHPDSISTRTGCLHQHHQLITTGQRLQHTPQTFTSKFLCHQWLGLLLRAIGTPSRSKPSPIQPSAILHTSIAKGFLSLPDQCSAALCASSLKFQMPAI